MKKARKLLTAAAALIVSLCLLCGAAPPAFAADETPPAETDGDCIKWDVGFDKTSYGLFDTATATVSFKNTSSYPVGSISFSAESDSLECLGTEGGSVILGPGATGRVTMRLQLSSKAPDLNIFARFLLAVRGLFKKGDALSGQGEADSVCRACADFGRNGNREIEFSLIYETINPDSDIEDDPGVAERSEANKFIAETLKKDSYTLDLIITTSDGEQSLTVPVKTAKSGDRMYLEMAAPLDDSSSGSVTLKAYLSGGKARIYAANVRAYYETDPEEFMAMIDRFSSITAIPTDSGYRGTYKGTSGGKNIDIDIYGSPDGTYYCYYEEEKLTRIEFSGNDGSSTITEIVSVTSSADSKLFREPTGYINISGLLKQDS